MVTAAHNHGEHNEYFSRSFRKSSTSISATSPIHECSLSPHADPDITQVRSRYSCRSSDISPLTTQIQRHFRATHADPGVFERLRGVDAPLRVHRQHRVDEVLGVRRHRVPFRGRVLGEKHTPGGLRGRVLGRSIRREGQGRGTHATRVNRRGEEPEVLGLPAMGLMWSLWG